MSTPPASSGSDLPLQFDQAEFTSDGAGIVCSACKSPITQRYYEANGQVVCEACRERITGFYSGGSKIGRAVKASILGFLAAVVGAVGYYAITKATGYNIGLVSVVVGVLIGGAVKGGSGGRGGRFYQFLALFLTYASIAIMLFPMALEEIEERQQAEQREQVERIEKVLNEAAAKRHAEAKNAPKPEEASRPEEASKAADFPKGEAPVEKPAAETAPKAKSPSPPTVAEKDEEEDADEEIAAPLPPIPVVIGAVLGLGLALPVLVAFGDPLSGLIYGFALWEAWKINKASPLVFNGPYNVESPARACPQARGDEEFPQEGDDVA